MNLRISGSVRIALALAGVFLFLLPVCVYGFTVTGSIVNGRQADGAYRTYVNMDIGTDFSGALPADIASIVVTGPGGQTLCTQDATHSELPFSGKLYAERKFQNNFPGSPAIGEYTFTVTTKDSTVATATDSYTVSRIIPNADSAKMFPAGDSVLSSKTPTFSWQQASYSGATLYYRIDIRDPSDNPIYLSNRKSGSSSHTIPAEVLQPGQSYKWRVRISDGSSLANEMNRSDSDWFAFTTASALQHASLPAIFPDGYGVVTFNTGTAINYDTSIKVADLDGIAFDGSSHTVTMKTPAGTSYKIDYSSSDSSTTATYAKYIDLKGAPPESGDFTFTVTDPDGNEVSLADALTPNPPPVPDVTSYSPAADSILADTAPTFTWAPVSGADAYRVRIYNADATKTIWTSSYGKQTSYTMPPGVLAPNTIYRYRIYARNDSNPMESDNVSVAPNPPAAAIPFTTDVRTDSPYISLSDGVSTFTSIGGVRETRLHFYILVYDAQGVPGNIRSVRVIFPSGHQETLYHDIGNGDNASIRGVYTSNPDLSPEAGSYTFIAEDRDGHAYSVSEELTVNPIGYPALTSLRPEMNAVINGAAVDFDWEDVPGAAFYKLQIYDINYNQILSRSMTESNCFLAAGFLKPGSLYRYRINAYREFAIDGMDNFSSTVWGNSDMFTFLTGPLLGGTASPVLDLRNSGVYLDHMADPRTGNSLYQLNFYARVTDPDGVPTNIASVRVTYPDGVTQRDLRLDSVVSGTQANYYGQEFNGGDIQPGDYTFTATDLAGNFVQTTDNLVIQSLPCPVNLSPGAGAVVLVTTPTIRWDPVLGASDYEVRISDGWNQEIYRSSRLTTNSFTVPAGILQMDATYSYSVYANREPVGQNLSNRSVSDYRSVTEMTHFSLAAGAGGEIAGLVTGKADGKPIEGIRIVVGRFLSESSAISQADGSYLISNLASGAYRVEANTDDIHYASGYYSGASAYSSAILANVDSEQRINVDFQLAELPVIMKGDVDGNRRIDLADALLSLQSTSGIVPGRAVFKEAAVTGDGKIGIKEAVYDLQGASEMRSILPLPIKIDGVLSPGEWDEATAVEIPVETGWTVKAFYKNESGNLYVAFTNLKNGSAERYPEVLLDVGNNKSETWDGDDWWFHASYNDCEARGRYNIWLCTKAKLGWSANNFPLSAPGTVEMKIEYGKVGLVPGEEKDIGIAFDVSPGNGTQWVLWPATATVANPASWGTWRIK